MCLVLIGWRAHPDYRLIVAANRDEFYTRPSESLRWWPEVPGLLAGRDIGAAHRAGDDPPGTWLGLSAPPQGPARFAAVTNVRDPADVRADARSRGALLMDFLRDESRTTGNPVRYLHDVARASEEYNGYNLVVSDMATLGWYCNRGDGRPAPLAPGFHGFSNGTFVTSAGSAADPIAARPIWPKVRSGLGELRRIVRRDPGDVEGYFALLADPTEAADEDLPHTGVPLELERSFSARFISHTLHGTRASTVLLVREDGGFELVERSFGELGRPSGEAAFQGTLELPG